MAPLGRGNELADPALSTLSRYPMIDCHRMALVYSDEGQPYYSGVRLLVEEDAPLDRMQVGSLFAAYAILKP